MTGNGNGERAGLTGQQSSRTSFLGLATAIGGLVSWAALKYIGDKELAAVVVTLFNSVAIMLANYGTMLAERGAKRETHAVATEAGAAAAAPVAAAVAAETVTMLKNGEDR